MFLRKKDKEKEIDIGSLNDILNTGRKIIKIGYVMAIIAIILLGTYLVKEWKVLGLLKGLCTVISPIFIGFLVAWLFDPVVSWLQSKKIPRIIGCILVYILIFGGLLLLVYLLIPNFIDQIKEFIGTIPDILQDLKKFLNGFFNSFRSVGDLNVTHVKSQIYRSVEEFGVNLTTNLPNHLISIGKSLLSGGMNFILGLMIGFYILFDFDKINKSLRSIMPRRWRDNYTELGKRINSSLRSYVQGLFSVMFLVFITQSIGLTIAGLKAPLIFALFCAITDVIPYFGPYIGAIPAVIVGFTISPLVGIGCIISIVVVQVLENNFYQPLIMGHTMKLHPVTIMAGLLLFQHFFGIIGMIVATPVVACIKVILTFVNEKVDVVGKVTGEEA